MSHKSIILRLRQIIGLPTTDKSRYFAQLRQVVNYYTRPTLKGTTSRFEHLKKLSLNFSVRFVVCNPCWSSPSLFLYGLLLSLRCFSILVKYYFQVSGFQNTLNVIRLMCRISGRSPSPMKGMRGTASSLDWDHSVDTEQSPQGKQMLPLILHLIRLRGQCGLVVRAPNLKSGGFGFKSRSDHLARIINRQLVCLLPVGIFKPVTVSWYRCCFSFNSSSKPVNKLGVTKRIYHHNNQHLNSYLFIYRWLSLLILFSVYFIDDESDGVEMGRSSSELSNLNEDWDSGMWRLVWTVHNPLFARSFIWSWNAGIKPQANWTPAQNGRLYVRK